MLAPWLALRLSSSDHADIRSRSNSAESTTIIVSSDHGGKGKGHGGNSMAEIEIPWIAAGAGVKEGYEVQSPVNTYDTPATAARHLTRVLGTSL